MTKTEGARIFRFAIIGGSATVIHIGTAMMAVELGGLSPELSTTVGLTAAFGVSYIGHRSFTFAVRSRHATCLSRFVVTTVAAYFLNVGIVGFFSGALSLPYQYGFGVVAVVVPLANYLMGRFWVFDSGIRDAAH